MPNIDDVARWLGSPPEDEPELGVYEAGGITGDSGHYNGDIHSNSKTKEPPMAKVLKVNTSSTRPEFNAQFGDDFRPVPLTKNVIGFEAYSEWALAPTLDKALMPELIKLQKNAEHKGKPVLVFCPTRKCKPFELEHRRQ